MVPRQPATLTFIKVTGVAVSSALFVVLLVRTRAGIAAGDCLEDEDIAEIPEFVGIHRVEI